MSKDELSMGQHCLRTLPEILAPVEGDQPQVLDRNNVVIEWALVTENYQGTGSVNIVEYEVIVEQVEPFRKFFVHLPASATSLKVSTEFLEPNSLYDVEVVAIESSANQSIFY